MSSINKALNEVAGYPKAISLQDIKITNGNASCEYRIRRRYMKPYLHLTIHQYPNEMEDNSREHDIVNRCDLYDNDCLIKLKNIKPGTSFKTNVLTSIRENDDVKTLSAPVTITLIRNLVYFGDEPNEENRT